jgi:hypothetical protein
LDGSLFQDVPVLESIDIVDQVGDAFAIINDGFFVQLLDGLEFCIQLI